MHANFSKIYNSILRAKGHAVHVHVVTINYSNNPRIRIFYIYFVAELYSSELPTHVSCSLMPETHLFHHELYQFICVTLPCFTCFIHCM